MTSPGLQIRLEDKQKKYNEIYSNYVSGDYSFIKAPALKEDIARLQGQIKDLNEAITETRSDLKSAEDTIAAYQNKPLNATAFGNAQQALAQVDNDLKFHSLLNDTYARGEALHGGSGTAHASARSGTPEQRWRRMYPSRPGRIWSASLCRR